MRTPEVLALIDSRDGIRVLRDAQRHEVDVWSSSPADADQPDIYEAWAICADGTVCSLDRDRFDGMVEQTVALVDNEAVYRHGRELPDELPYDNEPSRVLNRVLGVFWRLVGLLCNAVVDVDAAGQRWWRSVTGADRRAVRSALVRPGRRVSDLCCPPAHHVVRVELSSSDPILVDRGMVSLVRMFDLHPGVGSLSCCQGGPPTHRGLPAAPCQGYLTFDADADSDIVSRVVAALTPTVSGVHPYSVVRSDVIAAEIDRLPSGDLARLVTEVDGMGWWHHLIFDPSRRDEMEAIIAQVFGTVVPDREPDQECEVCGWWGTDQEIIVIPHHRSHYVHGH